MLYLFYLLICVAATTIGAISGIGGGVLIKPVMDAVGGMGVSAISFLSGCTVLAMSVVSLLRSRGGEVKLEPRRGTPLALGGAVGGVAGKGVFDAVKASFDNDALLGAIQSGLMIVLTLGVLAYVLGKSRIRARDVRGALPCLAIGLGLGVLSAFLGIGGGPINLAVLYYCFSMDTKTAALHSLYIILFSQTASLLSTLLQSRVPAFDPVTLAVMAGGGIVGGFVGRAFNKKMSPGQVDSLFRALLAIITAISCYNLWRYGGML